MDRRFLFYPTPSEKERHIIDEVDSVESRGNDEYRRDTPFERRLAAVILHSTWSIIDMGIEKTPWCTDGERRIQFITLTGRETAVRGIRISMECVQVRTVHGNDHASTFPALVRFLA